MTGTPAADPYFVSHETHSAVIMLVGDQAFKFKKPVNLGFLDYSTAERRQAVCQREVELNRRISPDVYQGVASVVGPDGTVCEHLVVMRRMPSARRLSALVRAGIPVELDLRRVARQLAVFHGKGARGAEISAEGSREAIRRRWTDSFRQVRALDPAALPDPLLVEIESLTEDFLQGRQDLFNSRIAAGRIVDGHGDLLADDIYCLDDGPRILDCIEFDDKLRWLDQLDDAAFLAMDLEYLGTPDLARHFLDWYIEFAADPAPVALRHHFIAYRAFVRAKVACLRLAQGDESARSVAVRHAELARAHLRSGSVTVVLVGGLPGSGKSTLSGALADELGAAVVATDRVRKELAGRWPEESATAPYGQGIYTEEWSERTYAEVVRRAAELLSLGESVVLDASWSEDRHRAAARALASGTHSRLVELRCAAPAEVTFARIRDRTRTFSDADEQVARAMAARFGAWPQALLIETNSPADVSLTQAVRAVRGNPEHLVDDGPSAL